MVSGSLQEATDDRLVVKALLDLSAEEWLLRRKGFRNSEKSVQVNETLLTIGNGYLNIRGSLEELPPGNAGGMYVGGDLR